MKVASIFVAGCFVILIGRAVVAATPAEVARAIDREIDARLADYNIAASELADDAEFLRRVCLDITGRIPTAERAAAFLDSSDADKRQKLIDELLDNANYGQHFSTIWTNLINAAGSPPRSMQSSFRDWLANKFNQGQGWDQIVRELLASEGLATESPATYFVRANTAEPGMLASTSAQFFLGVQIQCAECHDHPFTEWRQSDYWGLAVFFSRLREVSVKGGKQLSEEPQAGKKPAVNVPGAGIVIPTAGGNKGAGNVVMAKYLGGEKPDLPSEGAIRLSLASWVTAADNPYFAKAAVNRLWAHFFGRGFFNPVDDFQADLPVSHPQLLAMLAQEFASSGHDLKHLIRCICSSQAYQRTSRPLPENKDDARLFSHMAVKVMSPEAMYNSLIAAMGDTKLPGGLGSPIPFDIYAGPKAKPDRVSGFDEFIRFFNTSDPSAPSTDYTHGIPQILALMNAQQFNRVTPVVDRLVKSGATREQVVESLFLGTLTRRPSPDETKLMSDYLEKRSDPQQGYAGALWILFNSNEFVLNH
jgi:hypothetical protein